MQSKKRRKKTDTIQNNFEVVETVGKKKMIHEIIMLLFLCSLGWYETDKTYCIMDFAGGIFAACDAVVGSYTQDCRESGYRL